MEGPIEQILRNPIVDVSESYIGPTIRQGQALVGGGNAMQPM